MRVNANFLPFALLSFMKKKVNDEQKKNLIFIQENFDCANTSCSVQPSLTRMHNLGQIRHRTTSHFC